MSNDFIKGWKAALTMALEEPIRFSTFNTDEKGEGIFNISDNKNREMPVNLKELDKMLWMAFRAGQESCAESVVSRINYFDFTRFVEKEPSHD